MQYGPENNSAFFQPALGMRIENQLHVFVTVAHCKSTSNSRICAAGNLQQEGVMTERKNGFFSQRKVTTVLVAMSVK